MRLPISLMFEVDYYDNSLKTSFILKAVPMEEKNDFEQRIRIFRLRVFLLGGQTQIRIRIETRSENFPAEMNQDLLSLNFTFLIRRCPD